MGANIDEIAEGIYRVRSFARGLSFNQYLVMDEQPLLFHTGQRAIFADVRAAIERVTPFSRLRHAAFSHLEADECGAMNAVLGAAPEATPLCGTIAARLEAEWFDRPPRGLADGEVVTTGRRRLRWIETPHLPHGSSCGYLFDEGSKTLLCGDLFTQPGEATDPLVTTDILGPSEELRAKGDYFSHSTLARSHLERLAALQPTTLACMHGSAWAGDGAALLRALGDALAPGPPSP